MPPAFEGFRTIERTRFPLDFKEYKNRAARETDYRLLVDEPFVLFEPDGTFVMAYVELANDPMSVVMLDRMRTALKRIDYTPRDRTSGMIGFTRTFGAAPRLALRRDYCNQSTLAVDQPEDHHDIVACAGIIADWYYKLNPVMYVKHVDEALKVRPEYKMGQTAFTSGIINQTNPLPYHFDSGNFRDVWSAEFVLRDATEGGYLAFPEFGLACALNDYSLFMFDGQSTLHGVTPITKLRPDATRFTVVYYSLKGMWKCESITDELLRYRKLRTEREQKRLQSSSLSPKKP
jgi:hypothetical protein